MLVHVLAAVTVRVQEDLAASVRRRPVLPAAAVVLALLTVLLALLFVAVVLVAALEGLPMEGTRAANVVSAVGEAFSEDVLSSKPKPEPSARVCWFSRACR